MPDALNIQPGGAALPQGSFRPQTTGRTAICCIQRGTLFFAAHNARLLLRVAHRLGNRQTSRDFRAAQPLRRICGPLQQDDSPQVSLLIPPKDDVRKQTNATVALTPDRIREPYLGGIERGGSGRVARAAGPETGRNSVSPFLRRKDRGDYSFRFMAPN